MNDVDNKSEADAEEVIRHPQVSEELSDQDDHKPDPFAPERVREEADFDIGLTTSLEVTVRKPAKEWWIRTHPSQEYRLPTLLLEMKETRSLYFVVAELRSHVRTHQLAKNFLLVTTINQDNEEFIWPLRQPNPTREDKWGHSALQLAGEAQHQWLQVYAGDNKYQKRTAEVDTKPKWSGRSMRDLLEAGFSGGLLIDSLDHPVMKLIRGEF